MKLFIAILLFSSSVFADEFEVGQPRGPMLLRLEADGAPAQENLGILETAYVDGTVTVRVPKRDQFDVYFYKETWTSYAAELTTCNSQTEICPKDIVHANELTFKNRVIHDVTGEVIRRFEGGFAEVRILSVENIATMGTAVRSYQPSSPHTVLVSNGVVYPATIAPVKILSAQKKL